MRQHADTNFIFCKLYILIEDLIQKAPDYFKIQPNAKQETSKPCSCFWVITH